MAIKITRMKPSLELDVNDYSLLRKLSLTPLRSTVIVYRRCDFGPSQSQSKLQEFL